MKYRPFRLYTHTMGNIIRKMGGKIDRISPTTTWNFLASHDESGGTRTALEFWTAAAEYHWLYPQERNAIFPESLELCDRLMRAKFELGKGATLDFPYEVFAVFMPQGVTFGNMPASSFLVQLMPWSDRAAQAMSLQIDSGGPIHSIRQAHFENDEPVLALYYQPTVGPSRIFNVVVKVKDLMNLLSLDDPKAFEKALGFIGDNIDQPTETIAPDDEEVLYQKDLLKFVVSLIVYTSARDGEGLERGIPQANVSKVTQKGVTYNSSILKDQPIDRSSPAAHVRAMHFRNLRHEKFYQGDHESKPIGSRWSLVRETTVNPKMKTHTVKD